MKKIYSIFFVMALLGLIGCSSDGGDSDTPPTQSCLDSQHLEGGSCTSNTRSLSINDPLLSASDDGAFSGSQAWDKELQKWGAITTATCKAGRVKSGEKCSSLAPVGAFTLDGDVLPRNCGVGGTTAATGSTSESDCLNAPGYVKIGSNVFTKTEAGTFVSDVGGAVQTCPKPNNAKTVVPDAGSAGAKNSTECQQVITKCNPFYMTSDGLSCRHSLEMSVSFLNLYPGVDGVTALAQSGSKHLVMVEKFSSETFYQVAVFDSSTNTIVYNTEKIQSFVNSANKLGNSKGFLVEVESVESPGTRRLILFNSDTNNFSEVKTSGGAGIMFGKILDESADGKILIYGMPLDVGLNSGIIEVDISTSIASLIDIAPGTPPRNIEVISKYNDGRLLLNYHNNAGAIGMELHLYDPSTKAVSLVADHIPGVSGTEASLMFERKDKTKIFVLAWTASSTREISVFDPSDNSFANLGILSDRVLILHRSGEDVIFSSEDPSSNQTLMKYSGDTGQFTVLIPPAFTPPYAFVATSNSDIYLNRFDKLFKVTSNGDVSEVLTTPSIGNIIIFKKISEDLIVGGGVGGSVGVEPTYLRFSTGEVTQIDLNPGTFTHPFLGEMPKSSSSYLLGETSNGVVVGATTASGRTMVYLDDNKEAFVLSDLGGDFSAINTKFQRVSLEDEDDGYFYVFIKTPWVVPGIYRIPKSAF